MGSDEETYWEDDNYDDEQGTVHHRKGHVGLHCPGGWVDPLGDGRRSLLLRSLPKPSWLRPIPRRLGPPSPRPQPIPLLGHSPSQPPRVERRAVQNRLILRIDFSTNGHRSSRFFAPDPSSSRVVCGSTVLDEGQGLSPSVLWETDGGLAERVRVDGRTSGRRRVRSSRVREGVGERTEAIVWRGEGGCCLVGYETVSGERRSAGGADEG